MTADFVSAYIVLGVAAVLVSLFAYFFYIVTAFAAIMGLMIFGFSDSTLDKALHYPRPIVERPVAALSARRPLFMLAVKDASSAKNELAKDAKVPDATPVAKVDTEKSKRERPAHPHKLASRRQYYGWHDYTVAQGFNAGFGYRPGLDGQR